MSGHSAQRAHVLPLFLAMGALLLVTVVATYWSHRAALEDSDALIAAQASMESVQMMLSTIKDAETGQRGYLLTGEDSFLEPYNAALARINANLADLKSRAAAGLLPAADVEAMGDLVNQRLTALKEVIARPRQRESRRRVKLFKRGKAKE